MREPLDSAALAELLPGTWTIAATNFPMWLGGDRSEPRFTYGVVSRSPLVFSDDVSFRNSAGDEKHIVGKDTLRGDHFVWRDKRFLFFLASRWSVVGSNEEGTIVVIRFTQSLATPAGIDIIVKEGADVPELRATVAINAEQYGLGLEDFASLTWLPGN